MNTPKPADADRFQQLDSTKAGVDHSLRQTRDGSAPEPQSLCSVWQKDRSTRSPPLLEVSNRRPRWGRPVTARLERVSKRRAASVPGVPGQTHPERIGVEGVLPRPRAPAGQLESPPVDDLDRKAEQKSCSEIGG